MIDKYLIMTIPKSIKRQWLILGASVAMGVPYERIYFWEGKDAADYGNNMSHVAQAAADDGYTFLHQFAANIKTPYVQQSAGNIALFWNWANALKRIAGGNETFLLIWDDRMPNVKFEYIERMSYELKARQNLYLCQMRIRGDSDTFRALGQPKYADENTQIEEIIFKRSIENLPYRYVETYLQKSMAGYDETMILTPAGAAWLLEQMRTMDFYDDLVGFTFQETAEKPIYEVDPQPEQRSRLNNDNWLCWDTKLKAAVETALTNNKGIYCPKRVGFSFVKEALPFDSDVHWSPTGAHTPEKPTEIRFLR